MSTSPLLTPLTFLHADTSEMCSETRVRGLNSGRRFAHVRLLCPEFTLRSSPRITVRGHPVQGTNSVAAKSSASIKGDACGAPNTSVGPSLLDAQPKGVASKGRFGVSRGARKPFGCLAPLAPVGEHRHLRRQTPAPPAAEGGQMCTLTSSVKQPPAAHRCIGGRSAVSRR